MLCETLGCGMWVTSNLQQFIKLVVIKIFLQVNNSSTLNNVFYKLCTILRIKVLIILYLPVWHNNLINKLLIKLIQLDK